MRPTEDLIPILKKLRLSGVLHSLDTRTRQVVDDDLLIVDDLGLRTLTGEDSLDLYDIIRQRYERASTIITSNRDLTEWAPLFNDPLLASAAMDRLLGRTRPPTATSSCRSPATSPRCPRPADRPGLQPPQFAESQQAPWSAGSDLRDSRMIAP